MEKQFLIAILSPVNLIPCEHMTFLARTTNTALSNMLAGTVNPRNDPHILC